MAMNPEATTTNPSLRHRIPLYPTQFLCAMAIVSLGPLLNSMMADLDVPLSRGGLISAGLFLGNVTGIVILNTVMARVPAKRILQAGIVLQGASLIAAGAATFNLWSVLLAYLFVGFSGALLNATCWMWQSAHMKKNAAACALQMIMFFGLAMMVVPVVLGLALDAGATWRWILVAEGGLSLLTGVSFVFLPLLDIPGRQNVRASHLKQVVAFNPKLLLGMMGAGFTYVGAEMTMNVWLPKFQIDVFDAGDTWARSVRDPLLGGPDRGPPDRDVSDQALLPFAAAAGMRVSPWRSSRSRWVSLPHRRRPWCSSWEPVWGHPPRTDSSGATPDASRAGSPAWPPRCSFSPAEWAA